jgi:hypothetical protein
VVTTEFHATLSALGLAQDRVAKVFDVGPRSVRRWQHGDRRFPCGVRIVLRLLAAGAVTLAQVEQAAAPIPVRTNGSAEPEPPAPPRVESAPEQSAFACAAPTDSAVRTVRKKIRADHAGDHAPDDAPARIGLTIADKVCALTKEACRWPCGDPDHSDFHFCSSSVAHGPYCDHHRTMAYRAPPQRAQGVTSSGRPSGQLRISTGAPRIQFCRSQQRPAARQRPL